MRKGTVVLAVAILLALPAVPTQAASRIDQSCVGDLSSAAPTVAHRRISQSLTPQGFSVIRWAIRINGTAPPGAVLRSRLTFHALGPDDTSNGVGFATADGEAGGKGRRWVEFELPGPMDIPPGARPGSISINVDLPTGLSWETCRRHYDLGAAYRLTPGTADLGAREVLPETTFQFEFHTYCWTQSQCYG